MSCLKYILSNFLTQKTLKNLKLYICLGYMESRGYPDSFYPDNENCQWHLAPETVPSDYVSLFVDIKNVKLVCAFFSGVVFVCSSFSTKLKPECYGKERAEHFEMSLEA